METAFHTLFDNKPLSFDRLAQLQQEIAKHRPYLVYFTARSGSSYLADLLTKSQLAGQPAEFLNPQQLPKIVAGILKRSPQAADTIFDYLLWLLANRSSRNGAFGLKATYPHLRPLMLSGLDQTLFGRFTKFFLTRNNLVNQGISLYVMTETKLAHRNKEVAEEVVTSVERLGYDRERIRHWILHLWKQELGFRSYFKTRGEPVLELDYETLSEDPAGTLRKIADQCGIGELKVQQSDYKQVRGSKSEHLAAEFLADRSNLAFLKESAIPETRLTGA